MILVDTSVWIDHFRRSSPGLAALLGAKLVMTHPFVVGELACGSLRERDAVLGGLSTLPAAPVVAHADVLRFVARRGLAGRGIGWLDTHLLASATVAGRVALWTRDRRLKAAAVELGVAWTDGAA